ncbi:hypothetical protein [Vibrio gallaecicus]|nr:hypothetical protein [Vibrio gallaecicus]MDN3615727.1 hypothetical protein [Vibrio gallaecicus]
MSHKRTIEIERVEQSVIFIQLSTFTIINITNIERVRVYGKPA